MSLYKCTSCNELIQPTKARLSCASCAPRMTLCANCYVVQVYPPQHQDNSSHEVLLHKHSGFLPVPPPPPPRSQPVRSMSTSYAPTRRRPVSVAPSDVPPRKPPRPARPETRSEVGEIEGTPVRPLLLEPIGSPMEVTQDTNTEPSSQQQPEPTGSGWPSLLNEDMKPLPALTRIIEELFHQLDPQRTGFLTPEVYSEYLNACGAPYNHNISNTHGYDMADRELTDHFTAYSVDFALQPRTPPSTPKPTPLISLSYFPTSGSRTLSRFTQSQPLLSGGQKPMLSFRGFSELMLISVLLNPSSAWGQLNRVMKTYQIPAWTEWDDLPRDVLPLAPYQPEVERVRVLLEGARLNAQQEVDAVHARLELEKQGRQHALDLLDDRVWVYR
ncbi:uncharacterized protein BDV17DRAFT_281834 [Aspergillus undulatus]|uniref:uncharacterized protein n=1 Tax=Aspergillus undulatus TaxID=1810928 RepID=UPI003CCD4CE1